MRCVVPEMRLLVLLILVLCLGCDSENELIQPPAISGNTLEADTTLSYLALGDSYTIGTGVAPAVRLPNQLAKELLVSERIKLEPLEIVARNGWRTDNLANALSAAPPGEDWDLVSLLIGVNDQYQGFGLSGYQARFLGLLQSAIQFAGGDPSKVFVVSIPDYAFTSFGGGNEKVSQEIEAFNAAAKAIAQDNGVAFYDIVSISREGLTEPTLVANDNLHPSGLQYSRWVSEVLLSRVARQIRQPD